MRFHCKVCDNNFKKFVLFEGHFDFNDVCREKHNSFIQCYLCSQTFRHSAALKYHLQQHSIKRVNLLPKKPQKPLQLVPKITLKKQWNFKYIPPIDEYDKIPQIDEITCETVNYEEPKSTLLESKICGKKYQNLEQHKHQTKRIIRNRKSIEKEKSKRVVSVRITKSPSKPIVASPLNLKRFNQCSVCKIKLRHGGQRLVQHMKHHTDGKFKCEICDIKFSRGSLSWHQKHFHGMRIGQITCKICEAPFTSRDALAKHEEVHKKGDVKCTICNIRFTPNTLAIHQTQKHSGTKKMPGRFRCTICKADVKSSTADQHMQNHKHGKFKCKLCNIRFSLGSFIWHQKRHHPEIDIRLITRECNICKAAFTNGSSLRKHLKVHEFGQVKCEVCNIRFTANSLRSHQKKCHPDFQRIFVKQPCEICKCICHSKVALESHADMHRNGKFQCDTHKIRFTFAGLQTHNRRYHYQSMNGTPCPICKITLARSSYLEQHMKVHTDGNVKCEICKIRFTQHSLIHHQKTFHRKFYYGAFQIQKKLFQKQKKQRERLQKISHSSQFQCKFCKLFCGDAKKLENHLIVHNDGDVECRICRIPFTKNSLAFHEKRFHPENLRKQRVLKALQRHISDELSALDELESKEIPIILEDQYKQLVAETKMPYQCIICKLPCSKGTTLDVHMKVHIEGEYKCEICSAWFTKNSLEIHQRRVHSEFYKERILNGIKLTKESCEGAKENKFSEKKITNPNVFCDICTINCASYDKLVEHKKMHVNGDVECKVCNIRFTVHSLRYHQKRFHPDMPQEPRIVEHECTVCKIKCSDAKRLEVHMTVHTEADVECDLCKIPFTKPSLLYHMRRFHPDVYSNEIIEKALERNWSTSEGSTNTYQPNEDQYHCKICNINCKTRKHFDVHMKVHVKGDVKCQVCKIWFTKQSLKYHLKRFHPELNVTNETKVQSRSQCNLCPLIAKDEARLKQHMQVHRGNSKCRICNIRFTERALIDHYKRFHSNLPLKEHILKSIENCASRKSLHNCKKCGKSFTRICYLKLHMKTHRNGIDPVEIPFPFSVPLTADSNSDSGDLLSYPSDLTSDFSGFYQGDLTTDSSVFRPSKPTKTRSYECYVCKQNFVIASQLQDHVSRHVVYEQWVDPLNVNLSNWDPDELSEIISNQPLVLVKILDLQNVKTNSLIEIGRTDQNSNENFQETNLVLPEADSQNITIVESDYGYPPDTTQNNCDGIVEILSDSDEDCETIRGQLNARLHQVKEELEGTQNYTNELVYISSDDEGDITDSFHCYFCNGRFRTLSEFGEHGNFCHMKCEPGI